MPFSESSNSPNQETATATAYKRIVTPSLTWLCRTIVGGAFMLGGWAKSVDPYGTLYKMLEYFSAWGLHAIPREPVVMAAVALGALELTVGVCVLFGVLRRSSAIAAFLIMCAMLPLTAYIAIADPVSDCGCFGDILIVSNTATFLKNIAISACCVWLLLHNSRCRGVFHHSIQWLVVTSTVLYALILSAVGYNVQPVADFRPYPLGTSMCPAETNETISLIYEKNGQQRTFSEYELPDSTWTYIGLAEDTKEETAPFAVFDTEGDEADLFECEGTQLIFVVPDPGEHFLTRSRFANELAAYARRHDTSTAAIIGTSTAGLHEWQLLAAPEFDVYSADDTDLKTLVRGDIAAVYLSDGKIVWKRNLASIDAELPETKNDCDDALENIEAADDGSMNALISGSYIAVLLTASLVAPLRRIMRKRQ